MPSHPTFASGSDYLARLGDREFWWPYVSTILQRYGLVVVGRDLESGVGGTFPTFLYGEHVVKLFGGWRSWADSFRTERAAYRLLGPAGICAPRLIVDGHLSDAENALWPFLITTRMSGSAWCDTPLSDDERLSIAGQLGEQMRFVHRLRPVDIPTHEDCKVSELVMAAENSSLPAHLIEQIGSYMAKVFSVERVVVHADLTPRHVFVEGGRMTGVIDWGDALLSDRHYELAKLHLDLFGCNKTLLRRFLEASDWPVSANFAHRALSLSLSRQAHGLLQHRSMDVFHKIGGHLPVQEIGTLEELADALFAF